MNTEKLSQRTSTRGFTLVELMIAAVIVAILAAIALPSYQEHLIKGRRAAAQAFMMDLANKEKQYLLDARAYTTSLSTLGYATTPSEVGSYYTVTIATGSAPPSFTVTATPVVGGAQASDGALTLTDTGAKGPSGKW